MHKRREKMIFQRKSLKSVFSVSVGCVRVLLLDVSGLSCVVVGEWVLGEPFRFFREGVDVA
jgi:hypothetical protein